MHLEGNGIKCRLPESISSNVTLAGPFRIQVPKSQVTRAKKLIKELSR